MPVRVVDRGASRVLRFFRRGRRPIHTDVGVFGGKHKEGLDLPALAGIHEFGLGVPQHSWLRAWIDENRREILRTLGRLERKAYLGSSTPKQAAQQFGLWAVGEIQERITRRIPPPLAPATIARKGSDVPLEDTGQLKASIKSRVGS